MKQRIVAFLVVVFMVLETAAQVYPVQLVPRAIPPAPIYLSSYANAGVPQGALQLQILLNDLTITETPIRLKIYIESSSFQAQSKELIIGGQQLFLSGGIPLELGAAALAPYFRLENLEGIAPSVYGKELPEGRYNFCAEVFHQANGNRLSRKTCTPFFVYQNEPPILVAPQKGNDIAVKDPLQILFQWTPRHINVSNVRYIFRMVEIWDPKLDPQTVFMSSPPLFTTETSQPNLLYGLEYPPLQPNKTYAWQVQAQSVSGAEEIGLFKNHGKSEIFWFTYSTPCAKPEGITHEIKGAHQVNIRWEDNSYDIPEYRLRYRKKGGNYNWFESRSNANWVTLWDLEASTTYEYQMAQKCELVFSDYSPLQEFTTKATDEEDSLVDCSIPAAVDLDKETPLLSLQKGDTFTAGDFPVKVLEAAGSNGRFTGKGYVTIPYLKNIKVGVHFSNVFINAAGQLAEGLVVTNYDKEWGNILDVDKTIEKGKEVAKAALNLINAIKDALNLDVDKYTKEKIDEVVEAILKTMKEEDLPIELKEKVIEAARKLKESKSKYDEAKKNGNETDKSNSKKEFEEAKAVLAAAEKEIEKYKSELKKLLKKAITELYKEGEKTEKTTVAKFNSLIEQYEQEPLDNNFYQMDEVEASSEENILVSDFQSKLTEYEMQLGIYYFSKVLAAEESSDFINILVKNSKKLEINYFKEIRQMQDKGENDRKIIAQLKVLLRQAFTLALIETDRWYE